MKSGLNIFKKISDAYAQRYEPEGVRIIADCYWRMLLAAAFLLLVGVFLFSTWILLGVLEGLSAVNAMPATPPPALDKRLLDRTMQAVQSRKAQFEDLKTNRPAAISDPSR